LAEFYWNYDKKIFESFESKVNGLISKKITGKGWGYDPIFIPLKSKNTFAQLENKNKRSHFKLDYCRSV